MFTLHNILPTSLEMTLKRQDGVLYTAILVPGVLYSFSGDYDSLSAIGRNHVTAGRVAYNFIYADYTAPAGGQAFSNGGFESTVGPEWTLTNCARSDGTGLSPLIPRSGSFLLRGMQAASCSAVQTVGCVGYSQAAFTGYMNNFFANSLDTSRILVEAFVSGSWVAQYDTGAVTGTSNMWYQYSSTFAIPSGATLIRVSLIGTRSHGVDLDAYWDDISLILS